MKNSCVVIWLSILMVLSGCISAERKAEYAAWQASDDGERSVSFEMFESQYRQGWRERAEQKKKERLAREEAERVLARRKSEYNKWLASDDKEDGVTFEDFEQKYKKGWEARAAQKKQARLAKEAEARAKEAAEQERLKKERAEAERTRLAKEAVERAEKARLAMRSTLYEKTVEHDLTAIKKCYAEGEQYQNPFAGKRNPNDCWQDEELLGVHEKQPDWLAKWSLPRLNITEADALAGEALLSAFGAKYLPNAYTNYEKKRDALAELQQVFNEEFPKPWTVKTTSPKWGSFNKVLEKFVKVRTEFFLCHDELCHYWLLSRFGVLNDRDFASIDTKRLSVHLLPENVERAGYTLLNIQPVDGKISDFALKYAPESYGVYQKMWRECKELDALLSEIFRQYIQMDGARHSRVLAAAVSKRNDLARQMNALLRTLQMWYTDHKTTERSSDDVAKCDDEMNKELKTFIDSLPAYIKDHALGPVIAKSDFVKIDVSLKPEKEQDAYFELEALSRDQSRRGDLLTMKKYDLKQYSTLMKKLKSTGSTPGKKPTHVYSMQRTEVTQIQWMTVMGNNPSRYRGPDRPVEHVSWNDCREFLARASLMDGCEYRLPTEAEWEYACLAGGTGDFGKRTNGECGPLDVIGWYHLKGGSRAVALKEPNAWGLFDMHGNVMEWCRDKCVVDQRTEYVIKGGSTYCSYPRECAALFQRCDSADEKGDYGFRIVAIQK